MNIAIGNNGKTYKLIKSSCGNTCSKCCFRPGDSETTCVNIHTKIFNIESPFISCMKLATDVFGYTDVKDIYFYYEEISNENLNQWKNMLRRK